MFFDWTFVLLIPAMLLAMWAQFRVRSTYNKYAQIGVASGLSGADVVRIILPEAGIVCGSYSRGGGATCGLECIPGELTDHYDPRSRTLRLSEQVYHGRSIAALGIAAHESGHAIQHARAFAPLMIRNLVYPVCNLGSTLAWPLFFIGLIFSAPMLLDIGILLFSFAVFFTVLTLPVEFDASRRALKALASGGHLTQNELAGARKVLGAAALTYVAAAAVAALQLIRMLLLARDRD